MARTNDTKIFKNLLLDFIGKEDPVLELLKWVMNKFIEIESESKVGAEKGKHSHDRTTYFSGTRLRRFDTRLGTMYLMIPKLRKGGYIPFFVTEKKRSELALLKVVQEAYINGVSTRKIEKIAKELGIENISASQVSEINKGVTDQVEAFRNRKLSEEYPVLWVDALYEKIRDDERVVNMAILIVSGLNIDGNREILAVEPVNGENEENYMELFNKLKKRGLKKVWLCVSDAHAGLKNAISKSFIGSSWQRCKVHLMRNILAHIPHKDKEKFAAKLKQIWLQVDRKAAMKYAKEMILEYESKYPKAINVLELGLEESLQFFAFEKIDSRKIASTNMIERLNKEIRRRSKVVGIFPSIDSYIRLVTCYLIEYSEEWSVGKNYIRKELLEQQKELLLKTA